MPWGVTDRLRVEHAMIERLEELCDAFNGELPELKSFILPGGTETAARLHVARTICRRAERDVLLGSQEMELNPQVLDLSEPALRPALHPRPTGERRPRRAPVEAGKLALTLAGSFVAGYVGSMLGLVLGTLRLPLIVAVTGNPLAAAGTNIAISAAAAASGAVSHARAGRVDWRVVAWMAPPSIVGAVVGALVADDVSENLLYAAIAAVLVWSGVDLALRPVRPLTRERLRLWPAVAGGVGIGALGGAVGVILGTLRMPTLVRLVGHGREAGGGNQPRRGLSPRRGRLRRACRLAGRRLGGAGRRPRRRDTGRLARRARDRDGSTRTCFGSRSASILVLVGAVFAAQAARLAGRDRGDRLGELTRRRVARERFDGAGAERADAVCRLRCDGDHADRGEDRAQVADEADSVLVHVDDDDLDVA